jgi:D-cysteine desulfhydrase family pyridoxal phosphate-dependent enzyme
LRDGIVTRPRILLAQLPTPLEEAPRLSRRLGIRLFVKRDDLTGLALGGNKVRKLEFLIGDAMARGADTIITTGGSQSNHARLTAAACRKVSLDCHLVLDLGLHPDTQGNLLLDELFGAVVHFVESDDPAVAQEEMKALATELSRQGKKPYLIPRGGSVPIGAAGYAGMVLELLDQLEAAHLSPNHLYVCTGSCGTHAGILAGVVGSGASMSVQGISVSRPADLQQAKIEALGNETLKHLELAPGVRTETIFVDDRFIGVGYGHPTPEAMEAMTLTARDEAIILDPVYTAKTMAGMIGHVREGKIGEGETVIFVHTGGTPAVFAYHQELTASLRHGGTT